MNIVFEPYSSNSNTYVKIITSQLNEVDIHTVSLSSVLKSPKLFTEISVVHLNWFENVGGHGGFSSFWGFFKKIIKLYLLVISGKKIFWTFHNKKPHDQKKPYLGKYLMRSLAKWSYSIVIHSQDSKHLLTQYYGEQVGKKTFYVPHPHYIDVYGPRMIAEQLSDKPTQLSLLFLGAVKPYKNIELLIDVIKTFEEKDIHLTILGKAFTNEYANILTNYVTQHSNIALKLQFVKDEDIASTIGKYDLLVLPYDVKSSLNSGTAILAFSYGKTVICPRIGTIADYSDTPDILSYEYDSEENHSLALHNVISEALNKKKLDPEIFRKLGSNMYDQVLKQNNPATVAKQLSHMYNH